jgi:fatty-acyl-CoA synthase
MDLGIQKGDRVAILSRNCPQYLIYLYALGKMGAWITPMNFMLRGKEITQLIDHAEAKVFIVEDQMAEHVASLQGDMPTVKYYSMINLAKEKPLPKGWIDFDDLCSEKYSDREPSVEIDGNDVYSLMYTSGTEAMPKGVMNTHLNWHSTVFTLMAGIGMRSTDVFLQSLPFFHTIQVLSHVAIGAGAKIVTHYEPTPQEILRLISGEKVTFFAFPPTIFVNLSQLGLPKEKLRAMFPDVRKIATFGAMAPEILFKDWMDILPQVYWINYYGQSELTPLGAMIQHDDILRKYQTLREKGFAGLEPIGQPHYTVEMKVVDENDKAVPPWTSGEMVTRSPSVMLGYYKEEEKTNSTFSGGWHHTGDYAMMDEEGYLYFVDRKKDVIKTGGENVSSVEIEAAIFGHPKVAECAVLGLPHPRWMEGVTAFVVPKPNEHISEEEILKFCKEKLAGYKLPKKVIIIEKIPMNPSGKILKKDLRKKYSNIYAADT